MAIKDDIDCYPHPTNGNDSPFLSLQGFFFKYFCSGISYNHNSMVTGGTTWMHEVRTVSEDGVPVAKLRSCGVIFVGKANMHEMGMGTTGNNPNYG